MSGAGETTGPATGLPCAICGAELFELVERHWRGWVDDTGDALSYVPELHDHRPDGAGEPARDGSGWLGRRSSGPAGRARGDELGALGAAGAEWARRYGASSWRAIGERQARRDLARELRARGGGRTVRPPYGAAGAEDIAPID